MGKILTLAAPMISLETVATLVDLLTEAQAGEVIGIACVVIHRASQFSIDIAGEARKTPLLTRGMVAVMDDQLAVLMGSKRP
ncbi:MAG TPA: hypothetical protein VF516_03340 [Kofleriaceae bacterium]